MSGARLIDTMLDVEGEPTIYVCSPLQADAVRAWAVREVPGAQPLDTDVSLPDGRVLRIVMRRQSSACPCGSPLSPEGRCTDKECGSSQDLIDANPEC